jgi:hypothetical protein
MAVRYAGDVEIRMRFERGVYRVTFLTPNGPRGSGTLSPRECQLSRKEDRSSPEAYDKVARRVIGFLKAKGVRTGELRRVFQAPCPVPARTH